MVQGVERCDSLTCPKTVVSMRREVKSEPTASNPDEGRGTGSLSVMLTNGIHRIPSWRFWWFIKGVSEGGVKGEERETHLRTRR